MTVALEPHEEEWLAEEAEPLRRLGHDAVLLDAEAVRAEVRLPALPRGPVAAQRRRHPRPGEAGLGAARASRASWACGCTRARA